MCLLAGGFLFASSKALKKKRSSICSRMEMSQWIIQCGIRLSLSSESTSIYFHLVI